MTINLSSSSVNRLVETDICCCYKQRNHYVAKDNSTYLCPGKPCQHANGLYYKQSLFLKNLSKRKFIQFFQKLFCNIKTISFFILLVKYCCILIFFLNPLVRVAVGQSVSNNLQCAISKDHHHDFSENCSASFSRVQEKKFCQQYINKINNLNFCHNTIDNISEKHTLENAATNTSNIRLKDDKENILQDLKLAFCKHLPISSLLHLNITYANAEHNVKNCKEHLRNIQIRDCHANQSYLLFFQVMTHYALDELYSIQSNYNKCLESYKNWTCSNLLPMFSYDLLSSSWVKQEPCLSLCQKTEAFCPFFRIGNKSKQLGSQAVFLCQGLGAFREKSFCGNCYNDAGDVKPCINIDHGTAFPSFQASTSAFRSRATKPNSTQHILLIFAAWTFYSFSIF